MEGTVRLSAPVSIHPSELWLYSKREVSSVPPFMRVMRTVDASPEAESRQTVCGLPVTV